MSTDANISAQPLDETVETVLCALDRWTARNDGHHTEKRATRRHPYRALIEVAAQLPNYKDVVRFEAFTRDISVAGLAFVVSRQIPSEFGGQVVTAAGLLVPEKIILIRLPHGDHNVNLLAEIRRLRKVHDNLYEFGVRFVSREIEPTSPASPAPATN